MTTTIRRSRRTLAVLCATALVVAAALPAVAAAIHFEKETLQAYEAQLRKGEVHALTFHPGSGGAVGHLHISLNNGEHMSVTYATGEQSNLVARARAAGARVKVAAAAKKKPAPVKHKLRYIAGGILIVVIVVVLIVLFVGRRRAAATPEHTDAPGESPAST
jgi:magnesium-transporting ATPase (P-type)